jgi:hypothetical protein
LAVAGGASVRTLVVPSHEVPELLRTYFSGPDKNSHFSGEKWLSGLSGAVSNFEQLARGSADDFFIDRAGSPDAFETAYAVLKSPQDSLVHIRPPIAPLRPFTKEWWWAGLWIAAWLIGFLPLFAIFLTYAPSGVSGWVRSYSHDYIGVGILLGIWLLVPFLLYRMYMSPRDWKSAVRDPFIDAEFRRQINLPPLPDPRGHSFISSELSRIELPAPFLLGDVGPPHPSDVQMIQCPSCRSGIVICPECRGRGGSEQSALVRKREMVPTSPYGEPGWTSEVKTYWVECRSCFGKGQIICGRCGGHWQRPAQELIIQYNSRVTQLNLRLTSALALLKERLPTIVAQTEIANERITNWNQIAGFDREFSPTEVAARAKATAAWRAQWQDFLGSQSAAN